MRTNKLNLSLKFLIVIIFSNLLLACSNNHKESVLVENVPVSEKYEAISSNEDIILENMATEKDVLQDLKIIKSASVKYKVENVNKATQKINTMMLQFKAYISDQRFQNDLYQKENRFIIKVPEKYFAALKDSIVQVAEFVDYENITTDDVTEEYIDLQSRLKTKLEVKQRYEDILRKRAKTVKGVLAAEEKLGLIQEDMEVIQGRLKYLTSKVSYSTLEVELYETVDYKEEPVNYTRTFLSKTKEGFSFGWELVQSILLGIIYIWPILIIGLILFIVMKKKFRK